MPGGTNISVAPKHLIRYCAQETRRFNDRQVDDSTRFQAVMSESTGKQLKWAGLTPETEPLAGTF